MSRAGRAWHYWRDCAARAPWIPQHRRLLTMLATALTMWGLVLLLIVLL